MEYRFSLTPRLIALAIFSGVALMVLLFALGYQVGQSIERDARQQAVTHNDSAAPTAVDRLAGNAERQAERQAASRLKAAVPPAVTTVQKAAQ